MKGVRILLRGCHSLAAAWALLLGPGLGAGDVSPSIAQHVHRAWGQDQGLPRPALRALAQTPDGFLWIGTDEGLVRFDGQAFKAFNRSTHPEWKSQRVTALWVGHGAYLWIATTEGLARFDGGRFTALAESEGMPHTRVLALAGDAAGNLWAGTSRGLLRIHQGGIQEHRIESAKPVRVQALAVDGEGRPWMGTDGGLFRLEGAEVRRLQLPGIPAAASVRVLRWNRAAAAMWVGTVNGLFHVKGVEARRLRVLDRRQADHIISLAEDAAGRLWIGTQYGGLAKCRDESRSKRPEIFTVRNGLTNDVVSALLLDREENLWALTPSGLHRFTQGKALNWNAAQGLAGDKVYCVLEDRQHRLWVGTTKGLSTLQEGRTQTWALPRRSLDYARATWHRLQGSNRTGGTPYEPASVGSLCQTRDGTLWIGLRLGGLVRRDREGLRAFGEPEGLLSQEVSLVFEDRVGDLWVGTREGLSCFRRGVISPATRWDALGGISITCLGQSADGSLWVGTSGSGVFRIRGRKLEAFKPFEPYARGMVLCFREDDRGDLWFGTYGSGLVRVKGDRASALSTPQGMVDEVAYQMLEDGRGRLWVSTNKGICRMETAEARDCLEGRKPRVNPVVYGREEGLRNSECNGRSMPAGIRTEDGRLWFPTLEGLVEVDPGDRLLNPHPPLLHLEGATVNGQPFPNLEGALLPAGTRELTFQFVGLSLTHPSRVRYRYRLQGYRSEWIEAGATPVAAFTNLAPGPYRFEVTACNEDGLWHASGAAVAFEIRAPFWGRAWFKALVFVAGAILLNAGWWLFRRALETIRYWRETHLVGPYRLLDLIGEGGVGTVHRARDRRDGRIVALKVIHPDGLDEGVRRQFQREWEISAGLDHPNSARILEHGESGGRLFLAMELCGGPTLREVMRTRPLSIGEACAIARVLFRILKELHRSGVIHRDLKPENIIFRSGEGGDWLEGLEARLVLLDFGMARLVGSATRTRTGLVKGTLDYLSPEYLRGQAPADERMDVYAMGVIFYELLTGFTPYPGQSEDVMQRVFAIAYMDPVAPATLVPDIPGPVSSLAADLIHKDAATRLACLDEILLRFAALSP